MKRASVKSHKITDLFTTRIVHSDKPHDEIEDRDNITNITQTASSSISYAANMSSSLSPGYPDIATLAISELQSPNTQLKLLQGEWSTCHLFDFPFRSFGNKKRRFNPKLLAEHTWLRYSLFSDAVYCAYCVLFATKSVKDKSFSCTPISDWKNIGQLIARHCHMGSQHNGCALQAEHFMQIQTRQQPDVCGLLNDQYRSLVRKNREIIKTLLETIIMCGEQNIPLRGHTDEKSNFRALLNYRSKTDALLKEHLDGASPRATYISPAIQNEFISLLATQIRSKIVTDCNRASAFMLLADEATDKSNKEQISICVRFVHAEGTEVTVREEFLGFEKAQSTTGESLADALLTTLEGYGIQTEHMKGQGYDGASNMSGVRRGVQARIKARFPRADYVHCFAHCLNLAIVHACEEQLIRNMMSTVQEIGFAFSYSAKRFTQFEISRDTIAHELDRREKLRTLCETRWTARADALYTFKAAFNVVANGDDKANGHLNNITNFQFIITLVAAEHILQSTAALSILLQSKHMDLVAAVEETRVVSKVLQGERNDDDVWTALYDVAVGMAETIDVEPCMPRRTGRQINRNNVPADSPKQYYMHAVYYPFVDHLLRELNDRFIVPQGKFQAQYLIPAKLLDLTEERMTEIITTFEPDLPEERRHEARNEFKRWITRWKDVKDKPSDIADTLSLSNRDLYPNIWVILKMLLTLPVTTASAERSFSAMKRLKTYLRSTMTEERFSSLALMHIHRGYPYDYESVIDNFSAGSNRRIALIFQE